MDGRDDLGGVIDYFDLHRYIDISACSSDVEGVDPRLELLDIVENQEPPSALVEMLISDGVKCQKS